MSNGAITPTNNGNVNAFIDTGSGTVAFDLTGYFTPATADQFYDGAITSSNCNGTVSGWIRDLGSPNSQVYVTIFDNGVAKASGYASQYLGLGPTAGHDFSFNIGQLGQGSHAIAVKAGSWQPPSSPALLSCLGGTGGVGATSCPGNIVPPSSWRGISYAPREHPYWKMLDDWYDPATGYTRSRLASTVDEDLELMKNSGFNLVHLYLWDRDTFTPPERVLEQFAGFPYPDPSVPTTTNQWSALDAFFTLAETKGIWVYTHFVRPDLRENINANTWSTKADEYRTWTRKFVDKIAPTHCNVAAWGLAWETFPGNQVADPYSLLWRRIYKDLKDYTSTRTPQAGVGVDLSVGAAFTTNDGLRDKLLPRGSGYNWNLAFTTNQVQLMSDALIEEGTGPRPDYYNIQLFNSNTSDMTAFLNQLTALDSYGNLPSNHVPAAKIYVPEFSAASSLDAAGDGVMTWGDNQAPATTQFVYERNLSNTLCGFQSAGINKHSYWGRFDAGSYLSATGSAWLTFWTPLEHAWNDNFGVGFGLKPLGEKSAWSTLSTYYQSGTCNSVPKPAVALQTDGNYFTINQPFRARWTAVEYSSLSLSGGTNTNITENCTNPAQIVSSTSLDASCGATNVTFGFAGQQTITLTATNPSYSHDASRTVTIGLAPILTGVSNLANQAAIGRFDTIRISGAGFRSGSANMIRATQGSQTFYLSGSQASQTEITISLNNQLGLGVWSLSVSNVYASTSFSNPTQLNIQY